MTWPKKDTRRVSLRNGQSFLWHLDADWEWRTRMIRVKEVGTDGQVLVLDPYHHAFLPTQTQVRRAIQDAFRAGWRPAERRPPFEMVFDGEHFVPGSRRREE
ncbi:hypothetical protein [Allokutzneria albata]|uniref:Uncharacterized protein n=1 Tax=Allokutzneria albata TaxID=211114 RepID=A0A1G9RD27_ALLAB|nr:hypothetical protein [Allokutzneria albata]SDM21124.1 hypothetical protein SAMN04489726_0383 [Allokutzneria albata]